MISPICVPLLLFFYSQNLSFSNLAGSGLILLLYIAIVEGGGEDESSFPKGG